MALDSWQLLTRVLPGRPFGTGEDGALTVSSNTTQSPVDETCTGSSGGTSLTAGGTSLSNNDIVLLYQMYGTGEGQWEINRVSSGGGTTSLTMQENLQYTYSSGAQIIKIPQYTNVTINSGITWTGKTWASSVGGLLIFASSGILTPTGTLKADAIGLPGGSGVSYASGNDASAGGGSAGTSVANQFNANGSGGGGGELQQGTEAGTTSGGGGGNGGAGANGGRTDFTKVTQYGRGGDSVGSSGLTDLGCPGAGGGGTYKGSGSAGSGGRGAGSILIFARNMTSPGAITADGASGGASSSDDFASGAGGGAGGNILIQGGIVDIGTNKLGTIYGSGGVGTGGYGSTHSSNGGVGANGRMAIYYGSSVTGSTSASWYGSYTSEQDGRLVELGGSFIFNML